jgi:hypothetical protein
MSTATTEKHERKTQRPDAGDTPEQCYRKMVIASVDNTGPSEPDPTILDQAVRLAADFTADGRTYRRRVQAVKELREIVPRLEQEAVEAQRRAAAVVNVGDRPISDFGTVAELAEALQAHFQKTNPAARSQEQVDAVAARNLASSTKAAAVQLLNATCDPSIHVQIEQVRREIGNVQSMISNRRGLITLERQIAEQTELANQLSEGKGLSQFQARNDFRRADVLYAEAKAQLRKLIGLRPAAEAARKENMADQEKIGTLQRRIGELETEKLIPERMAWSN